jgi:hypothetical protein
MEEKKRLTRREAEGKGRNIFLSILECSNCLLLHSNIIFLFSARKYFTFDNAEVTLLHFLQ